MTRCMHVKYSICNKSNSVESSKFEFLWAKGFILNYREVDIKIKAVARGTDPYL